MLFSRAIFRTAGVANTLSKEFSCNSSASFSLASKVSVLALFAGSSSFESSSSSSMSYNTEPTVTTSSTLWCKRIIWKSKYTIQVSTNPRVSISANSFWFISFQVTVC
ncbi:hypothetical protein PUN28_016553 [Cardiocondyla obscurior]|uniref:Secreted protein n=1 Tax=Cardiocondyla obscurior TaxID=286306 RepID=A0AAW2EML6_9HYME